MRRLLQGGGEQGGKGNLRHQGRKYNESSPSDRKLERYSLNGGRDHLHAVSFSLGQL